MSLLRSDVCAARVILQKFALAVTVSGVHEFLHMVKMGTGRRGVREHMQQMATRYPSSFTEPRRPLAVAHVDATHHGVSHAQTGRVFRTAQAPLGR